MHFALNHFNNYIKSQIVLRNAQAFIITYQKLAGAKKRFMYDDEI